MLRTGQRMVVVTNIVHEFLVAGADFDTCRNTVLRFFERTILVKYDAVRVNPDESLAADHPRFWQRVRQGEAANRQVLGELIDELRRYGPETIHDLLELPQGVQSKTLHVVTHLLDGFFGIDTSFYSLVDDSHWVSDNLGEAIAKSPSAYWLIRATGSFASERAGKVSFIRAATPGGG